MFLNRRSSERLTLTTPIRYQQKGSQRFGNSVGRDISEDGIGFISNEFFPVSTQLIIEAQHPHTLEVIKKIGEVAWVANEPYSERFYIGAKFIEPSISL